MVVSILRLTKRSTLYLTYDFFKGFLVHTYWGPPESLFQIFFFSILFSIYFSLGVSKYKIKKKQMLYLYIRL